jgi:hypothetical protein
MFSFVEVMWNGLVWFGLVWYSEWGEGFFCKLLLRFVCGCGVLGG